MSKATITIEGFVANEPRLNRAQNGKAVISVTVPHQRSRKLDGGGYENTGETTWAEATFWEEQAEAVAQLVQKGVAVIVTGDPELQTYEKRDGGVGAKLNLRFPTIGVVVRPTRQQGQGSRSASKTAPQPQWDTQGTNGAQAGAQAGSWATAGNFDDPTPF